MFSTNPKDNPTQRRPKKKKGPGIQEKPKLKKYLGGLQNFRDYEKP